MAIDYGQGLLCVIYGIISVINTELLRNGDGEKKKKVCSGCSW